MQCLQRQPHLTSCPCLAGQDDDFGSSGPRHALVIRSFILLRLFILILITLQLQKKIKWQQNGTVSEAELFPVWIWVKVSHIKAFNCLKKKNATSFTVVGVQLPQQMTISNQFTRLFFNDPLISPPLTDQKPFSNGVVGKRSLHLDLERQITQP